MERATNLEFFIENTKDDNYNTLSCGTCKAMGTECGKLDHCPTLSELAEFLNDNKSFDNNVLLSKLEYDVLDCLNIDHKCALMEEVPVIRDFISKGHFKYACGKGLTIQYILDHAKVVD